ncbi:MAG: MxaK protein [Methylococcaceae bacterium]|nr:MxaK protein [Methylococcaceae bacterium]
MSASLTVLEWNRINRENDWIAQLLKGEDINLNDIVSAKPETRLARALFLQKQGLHQDALATLSILLDQGGRELRTKTRYNLGNHYLRQAIAQIEAGRTEEAKILVNLAKQAYREALLRDSGFSDAKYNLEVAMRLLPDFDQINTNEESPQEPKNPLWTTVPGFPRGLP